MKKCPKCGNQLNDYSTFCSECGTKIIQQQKSITQHTKICPKCGTPINSYSVFCPECGVNINQMQSIGTENAETINKKSNRNLSVILVVVFILVVIASFGILKLFNNKEKSSINLDLSSQETTSTDESILTDNELINADNITETSITEPTITTIDTTTLSTTTTTVMTTIITTTTTTTKVTNPPIKIPNGNYYSTDIEGLFLKISGDANDISITIRCDTYGSGGYCPYDVIKAHGTYNYDTEQIEYSKGNLEYVESNPDGSYRETTSKNECGSIIIDNDALWLTFEKSNVNVGSFNGRTFKLEKTSYEYDF